MIDLRNEWISCVLGLALVFMTTAPAPAAADAKHPNIIFVLADDVGCDWIHCYGAGHATPNIDRLASQGVRFETAWATPLCTPTRTTLLTGTYPFHTGWTVHYDVPRWGGKGFDPERFVTFARPLKAAGYATAIAGKWQINDLRTDPDILKKHGFDEHCLWPGGEKGNPPADKRYWDAFLQTNNDRRSYTGKFGPDVVHAFVTDFIKRHKDGPFFIYYPMIPTHAPNEPTPLNKDNPPKGEAALYAGTITYMDFLVGELTKTLDELGIANDTVVFFAGDNGSSTGGSLNGSPIRGGKSKISDLGVHIPFIVRAPMVASPGAGQNRPQGVTSEALVDFTDVYPTLLELSGATAPPGVKLDGHSLVPVLNGSAADTGRTWIYSQLGADRTVRDQRFKLDSAGGFFDVKADRRQEKDLGSSNDPEAVAARERLGKVLASIPPNAGKPFPEFEDRLGERKQIKKENGKPKAKGKDKAKSE